MGSQILDANEGQVQDGDVLSLTLNDINECHSRKLEEIPI